MNSINSSTVPIDVAKFIFNLLIFFAFLLVDGNAITLNKNCDYEEMQATKL
jgi:hypothetical protein